ncbi:MAG: hypothetical protein V3U27_00900 [Candidatus Tectomicrobia bacterium]
MAGTKTTTGMKDVMTAYKAWFVDLPLAGTRWSIGLGSEQETTKAAWSGYDATLRLASATIDSVYRTPLFGASTARALEGGLRWQQVGNAMTRTLLAGVVQTAGLPTQADTKALRAEVAALRAELGAFPASPQMVPADKTAVNPDGREETVVTPLARNPGTVRRAA